jgi:dinuclear metal center YbgI/SA1388 family protein
MLCLTVTEDIIKQAKEQHCDMIISHHPCFYIPIAWSDINIYCAHTNIDKAYGGTTDTLIENLGLSKYKIKTEHDFLRLINYKTTITDFNKIVKQISPHARLVNNKNKKTINIIAFCSGSGSSFIEDAIILGADCLVTGDLKFHTALDSPIVVYDIGHFESEIMILSEVEKYINNKVKIIYAKETSPFIQI